MHELVGFFSDDAVFIDGPRGVHRGIDAPSRVGQIRSSRPLPVQVAASPSKTNAGSATER